MSRFIQKANVCQPSSTMGVGVKLEMIGYITRGIIYGLNKAPKNFVKPPGTGSDFIRLCFRTVGILHLRILRLCLSRLNMNGIYFTSQHVKSTGFEIGNLQTTVGFLPHI